jgi:hypothetical protein
MGVIIHTVRGHIGVVGLAALSPQNDEAAE